MIQSFTTIASKAYLAMAFCTITLVLSVGASVHGDEYSRIDNKAKKIQKKSKLLIKETTQHYRNTAQYTSLIDAITGLHDTASHIHQVVHVANSLNHLQTDLADLDQCFHQLEGLFAAAEDAASRGHGHVHGNTAYAKSLLRSIEVSIDSMRKDVRKLQSRTIAQHYKAYPAAKPVVTYSATHDGYRYVRNQPVKQRRPRYQQSRQANGFSFSIGGGSSRLQFNF